MAIPPTRSAGSSGHVGDHNDIAGELTSLGSRVTAAASAAAAAQTAAAAATSGGLVAANNLSDLPDPSAARNALGINLAQAITVSQLPGGLQLTVRKNTDGTWPVRPTNRTDLTVAWLGADPSPAVVNSGTAGMLNGIDLRYLTP